MIGEVILYDIEGELYTENTGNIIYSKRLSLERSWNTDDFEDLALPSCSCVSEIHEDFDNKMLVINYKDGIQPFTYDSLKQAISPQLPFGEWRYLRFAHQICDCLRQFHQFDLYQLVIHPDRIALYNDGFVFLPTFSGVLPPLPELLYTDKQPRWLYYVSPEVIRTRGLSIEYLKGGDIYSAGRLLWLLLCEKDASLHDTDPRELCQAFVEKADYLQQERAIDFPEDILSLVRSMCSADTKKRPDLENVAGQIFSLMVKYSPISQLKNHMIANDFENAEKVYKLYTEMASLPPFIDNEVSLLYCDMLVLKNPPEYSKAIGELEKMIGQYPEYAAAYMKKGDIYSEYTEHSQHLLLSADAYKQACMLNEWDGESQYKFIIAVSKLDTIEKIVRYFSVIPFSLRIPQLNFILSDTNLRFGNFTIAWNEIVQYFRNTGFSEEAYALGLRIAKNMDPITLIKWKYDAKAEEDPNLKAALSIVFVVNNNPEIANKYLSDAINPKK